MTAPSDTAEYRRMWTRKRKVCHICHRTGLEVREMPQCVDCGLRVCADHSDVAYDSKSQGRKPRICNVCRERNCNSLLTCEWS